MSLETIYQELRRTEKKISIKGLLLFSLICGTFCAGVVLLHSPNYLSHYEQPVAKIMIISMFIMAFMTIPMIFVGGTLAFGIILTLFLIQCRDRFYYANAIITGKSLSFNDNFLNYLTENLFPRLAGFIKSYNNPRFDESDLRVGRLENDVEELKAERVYDHRIIAEQKRTIFDLKWEKDRLENQLKEKNENSIPLEEFEKLSARLLKVEEELRKFKGE